MNRAAQSSLVVVVGAPLLVCVLACSKPPHHPQPSHSVTPPVSRSYTPPPKSDVAKSTASTTKPVSITSVHTTPAKTPCTSSAAPSTPPKSSGSVKPPPAVKPTPTPDKVSSSTAPPLTITSAPRVSTPVVVSDAKPVAHPASPPAALAQTGPGWLSTAIKWGSALLFGGVGLLAITLRAGRRKH